MSQIDIFDEIIVDNFAGIGGLGRAIAELEVSQWENTKSAEREETDCEKENG